MTTADQPRRMAWRFKVIQQACERSRNVARTCRHFGISRQTSSQKHRSHAKRWQRYEKPQPGHRLRVDVKFLERIPGTRTRFYQFTAIDDCARVRVLKICDACNQGTAIRFDSWWSISSSNATSPAIRSAVIATRCAF